LLGFYLRVNISYTLTLLRVKALVNLGVAEVFAANDWGFLSLVSSGSSLLDGS